MRRLRASHPGVALRLVELGAADIVAGVAAGDFDVGLVCAPVTDPALAAEVVYREPVVLALPAAHPLAVGGPSGGPRGAVPLVAAAGEPFVLYERAAMPAAHDATVALCRAAGFGPRVAQEAGTEAAVVGLVAAGLGLAIVPASAATAGPAGVAYRPLAEAAASGAIALSAAWRRGDAAPLVAAFVRAAHEAAQNLDAGEPPEARPP